MIVQHIRLNNQTLSCSRTSKTKRREERKKARGKKGTIYEEEYIVGSLKRLYERASGMQGIWYMNYLGEPWYLQLLTWTYSRDRWYDQDTYGLWTC